MPPPMNYAGHSSSSVANSGIATSPSPGVAGAVNSIGGPVPRSSNSTPYAASPSSASCPLNADTTTLSCKERRQMRAHEPVMASTVPRASKQKSVIKSDKKYAMKHVAVTPTKKCVKKSGGNMYRRCREAVHLMQWRN